MKFQRFFLFLLLFLSFFNFNTSISNTKSNYFSSSANLSQNYFYNYNITGTTNSTRIFTFSYDVNEGIQIFYGNFDNYAQVYLDIEIYDEYNILVLKPTNFLGQEFYEVFNTSAKRLNIIISITYFEFLLAKEHPITNFSFHLVGAIYDNLQYYIITKLEDKNYDNFYKVRFYFDCFNHSKIKAVTLTFYETKKQGFFTFSMDYYNYTYDLCLDLYINKTTIYSVNIMIVFEGNQGVIGFNHNITINYNNPNISIHSITNTQTTNVNFPLTISLLTILTIIIKRRDNNL